MRVNEINERISAMYKEMQGIDSDTKLHMTVVRELTKNYEEFVAQQKEVSEVVNSNS